MFKDGSATELSGIDLSGEERVALGQLDKRLSDELGHDCGIRRDSEVRPTPGSTASPFASSEPTSASRIDPQQAISAREPAVPTGATRLARSAGPSTRWRPPSPSAKGRFEDLEQRVAERTAARKAANQELEFV